MSVLHKKSARLRDEERARLIWLLSTDKAVTSALLGKLTLAERYDEGTLADDLAEVEMLVSHLPPPDLADALEALPYDARTALWCLVPDDKRGEVRPAFPLRPGHRPASLHHSAQPASVCPAARKSPLYRCSRAKSDGRALRHASGRFFYAKRTSIGQSF
jgi:hypothetical protein